VIANHVSRCLPSFAAHCRVAASDALAGSRSARGRTEGRNALGSVFC
jgi:hypothetical protein